MPPHPVTTLTFIKKEHEYADVYSYFFEPAEPVAFTAGSYGHVRLLSLPEDARRVREFSFASAPHEPHIMFGIDNGSGSDYQRALTALQPGDTVELFKIKSHFTWTPPEPYVVMIAGGIGITPFRSMLRDAAHRHLPHTATILHVARESFAYEAEVRRYTPEYRAIHRDALEAALQSLTQTRPTAHYYVAGSTGFVDAVAQYLTEAGISTIETDTFKGLLEE